MDAYVGGFGPCRAGPYKDGSIVRCKLLEAVEAGEALWPPRHTYIRIPLTAFQ